MQLLLARRAAVFNKQTVIPSIIRLSHGRVNADICCHTTQDQISNFPNSKQQFEVGVSESAITRLINHRFVISRIQLRNDIVARLATNEQATKWSLVSYAYT